jgi:CMP/dCMP kinase
VSDFLNREQHFVVAIDGPAGSGKSSVSRAAAKKLGFDYLDTGSAYRGLAWFCIEHGVDTYGPSEVIEALDDFEVSISTDPAKHLICVGTADVTDEIREPRISQEVSAIARIPKVRAFLTDLFHDIIGASEAPGIVVEGRDITTVVAPHAQVRILLTAIQEVRMARRSAELGSESAAKTAQQLSSRDAQDSQVVDFMNAAAGVYTIDSTNLDFDQTVQAVVDLIQKASPWPTKTTTSPS